MSDELFDMFDDEGNNGGDGSQGPSGSQLRQFAEAMQKEVKELRAWRESREAADRRSSLQDALNSAGKDPAAVSLIPDNVTDADGVTKWLEANGALIKDKDTTSPPADGGEGQEQHQETQQPLTEEAKKLAAVSGAPNGVPPGAQETQLDQLAGAESEQQFYEMLDGFAAGQPQ